MSRCCLAILSTLARIEILTDRYLAPAIADLAGKKQLDIVTHSMGGIMLRYYLQKHRIPSLGRIVMFAPGHASSPMISLFRHIPLWRLVMGPAGPQSGADEDGLCA